MFYHKYINNFDLADSLEGLGDICGPHLENHCCGVQILGNSRPMVEALIPSVLRHRAAVSYRRDPWLFFRHHPGA